MQYAAFVCRVVRHPTPFYVNINIELLKKYVPNIDLHKVNRLVSKDSFLKGLSPQKAPST